MCVREEEMIDVHVHPGPALLLSEVGGCLGRWAKGGARKDQKIELCSGRDEHTPGESEWRWWMLIEHTFMQFMQRYRYYTILGLVQKDYSYQFQLYYR